MWTLYAKSMETEHQRTIPLVSGKQWLIGRSSSVDISIPWDRFLSRKHLCLSIENQGLLVERLPEANNRILYQTKAVDRCSLQSGDEFLVGGTLFQVMEHAEVNQETVAYEEVQYLPAELKSHNETDSAKRLDLLSTLPELLERSSREEVYEETILELLEQGIQNAQGILILKQSGINTENNPVEIVKYFSRIPLPAPRISQRLWNQSVLQSQRTVLHLWDQSDSNESAEPGSSLPASEFTVSPYYNWAFCIPVELPGETQCGIYVYGQHAQTASLQLKQEQRDRLQADVKFAYLMMELASAVVRGRRLEKQQILLQQFFPKEVFQALQSDLESNILEPRDCDLTVLFCDLSNFTTRAEQHSKNLFAFLEQVSQELECATTAILRQGGVIGDFHGDAVMGFWGWPMTCEQAEEWASLAALEIQQSFKALQKKLETSGNSIRIGISSGHGIVGKIGTRDQMKVTAFGSVVNRAERLQGIGKQLRSAITLDQATVENLNNKQSSLCTKLRPLGKTKAKGIEQ
ncbi:MAG: adenylate/guanylate cyclase domain-containing protein, partial [Planctomycetaceae bacterium]|nr:adenylate/guanylate cyclase domain-containing protein [Planctomycetaceae bacterium]